MLGWIVLISVVLFIAGAAVGSFLNVVVYRTLLQEQWVSGRSRCDFCEKPLAWFDNIPLVSYVALHGKSRCCHNPLSVSHPVVELLMGSLFVWWYWGGALFFQLTQAPLQTLQPLFWLVVGMLLLLILVVDATTFLIPDFATFSLIGLAFIYRGLLVTFGAMQPVDLLATLISTFVVLTLFYGLWWFTKGRGLGFGDVKLSVALGLLLGWPNILVGVFLSFVIGALVGLGLLAAKKAQLGKPIPFGPFMVIAIGISLLWGDALVGWYLSLLS